MNKKTYKVSVEPVEITAACESTAIKVFERMLKRDELVIEIEEVTEE